MDKNFFQTAMVGSKLTLLKRTCDLVMFQFTSQSGQKLMLHTQCFLRLFEKDQLVLSSQTLYTPGKKVRKRLFHKFRWTNPGEALFDDIVSEYRNKLTVNTVREVFFKHQDLYIIFENDFHLEVLVDVTKFDDQDVCENYRIFDEYPDAEHYIV